MKRHILLTALLSLFSFMTSVAQNGNIQAGISGAHIVSVPGTNTYTYNTANTQNNFFIITQTPNYGSFTNDIFYQFYLPQTCSVSVINNASIDNLLWLFQYSSNTITMIANGDGDDEISVVLQSGTYYVVAEGLYSHGNIATTFTITPAGDNMSGAINVGSFSQAFSYSGSENTSLLTNQYNGRSTNDVYYKFTLTRGMVMTFTHEGSSVSDTYMHILNSSGTRIAYNDDYSGEGHCTVTTNSYIKKYLDPGTYYVVSEGYSSNGIIKTNISGTLPPTGDSFSNSINAGSYSSQFTYSNTVNTTNYSNQYSGRSTNDVYHKFVITTPMNVTITHNGSSLADTYMSVLDANENLIVSNDNYSGTGHCTNTKNSFIQRQLSAGTYYVVSEGYSSNGGINLNITGNASPEFGYSSIPSLYSSQSTSVGALGGSFDVSPMGGATYSVPIKVPKGYGNMTPQLSITYNSQAGNGLCGYGANIGGISVITRGAKDIYHDGMAQGVSYLADDALYLNGVRLILDDEYTAGQNGAIYYPESDPFTKVIAHGTCTSTSNNTWYEVKSSDGMVYRYGTDSYSKLSYTDANGAQKIHSWYITKAIEPTGNCINYTYDKLNNYIYPLTIEYGTNEYQPNTPINKILFSYQSRPDVIPVRFDGKKGVGFWRLSSITCQTNNTVYRKYMLNYNSTGDGTGTKYSRLVSITERNGQNEELPAIQFNWSYLPAPNYSCKTQNNMTMSTASLSVDNSCLCSADLNGDGIDDIIRLGVSSNTNDKRLYLYKYMSNSSNYGNASYSAPIERLAGMSYTEIEGDYPRDYFLSMATHGVGGSSSIDYYGEGKQRLLVGHRYCGLNMDNTINYLLEFIMVGQNDESHTFTKLSSNCSPLHCAADIDNDGKTDIVVLENTYNSDGYAKLHILSSSIPVSNLPLDQMIGLPLTYSYDYDFYVRNTPKRLFLSDLNGNGMIDMLILYNNGFDIVWNKGGSITPTDCPYFNSWSTNTIYSHHGTELENWNQVIPGDFDGDGLLDILTNGTGSNDWYFHINNGDGSFNRMMVCSLAGVCNQKFTEYDDQKLVCEVVDFDRDGKQDVVITKAVFERKSNWIGQEWGRFQKTHTYWMRSTGTTLEQVFHATSNREDDAWNNRFLAGDFNGDGYMEVANYGYNCLNSTDANTDPLWRIYTFTGHTAQSGKVTSIVGDYGATTSITYSNLADPNVYTIGATASYPAHKVLIPLNVVKKTVSDNGAAGSITCNYSYEGLKIHSQGKGMLGFTKTQRNNVTQGAVFKTEVLGWNETYYSPSSIKTSTIIESDTSQSISTINYINKGGKKYFSYPAQVVDTDMDDISITTTRGYDPTNGYKNFETVLYAPNMYKTVQYSDYELAGNVYQPQTVTTIQRHANDDNTFSSTVKYSYASGSGNIIQKITNFGTANRLTTQYTYDMWGNLTSEVSSGTGVIECTTHYTYDNTHRFLVRVYTNPVSSVQKYTYDIWGNLLSECDSINTSINNTVTYTYDNWGNKVRTHTLDSGDITTTFGWGSDNSARYYILEQGKASPWVKTWYDNQSRVVKTESVGPKDMNISTSITYNNKGLKASVTETTGNLSLLHSYTYDSRGRVKTETHPGNSSITYSYGSNGRTKTVTDNGRSTTYTYDEMGLLKKVQSPLSSTVQYTYYSNGKVKSSVANGVTWAMEYDNCGNQTKLIDPDAGTSQFTYDALGRIIQRIDGRGTVFVTYYDYLGRVVSESAGGLTTTYTYGTSGTGQMRLTSESNGSWIKSYVYDTYGKVSQETLRNTSNSYSSRSISYHYNNTNGLLTSIDYPNGKSKSLSYDSYGNCTNINVNNGLIVWTLTGNTGTTTSSSIQLYNTTPYVRTTQLDNNGNMQSRVMTRGNTTVQNDNYVIDPKTGNLTSRTLTGHSIETFEYDDLDRLVDSWNAQMGEIEVSYQQNGNINTKTNMGLYSYNSNSKPHAVNEILPNDAVPDYFQYIEYNLWNKADDLFFTVDNNDYYYNIEYGPDQQRVKTRLYVNNELVCEKFYFGDYEELLIDGVTLWTYWIDAPDGLVGMFGNSSDEYYTVLHPYVAMTDNLGSLTGLYDHDGNKTFEATYDAWGKRTLSSNSMTIINRGFTGHEHIDEVGLINMNGRLYDPQQGRFLNPDPFVQAPTDPQNFNRYSYCLNNPLKYTDPDGEFWHLVIGGLIGGTVNWISNGCKWDSEGAKYFGIGFVAGAVGAGVGAGISSAMVGGSFGAGFIGSNAAMSAGSCFLSGMATGAGAGFTGGFVSGFGNELCMNNGSLKSSLLSGLAVGVAGGASGMLIGGLSGGISAVMDGRTFVDGSTILNSTTYESSGVSPLGQVGDHGCTEAGVEIVDKSFGGDLTASEFRAHMGGDPNSKGLEDLLSWKEYHKLTGHRYKGHPTKFKQSRAETIFNELMDPDTRAYVNVRASANEGHSVILKSATRMECVDYRGLMKEKFIFKVADPGRGGYFRNMGERELRNAFNVFFIYK